MIKDTRRSVTIICHNRTLSYTCEWGLCLDVADSRPKGEMLNVKKKCVRKSLRYKNNVFFLNSVLIGAMDMYGHNHVK